MPPSVDGDCKDCKIPNDINRGSGVGVRHVRERLSNPDVDLP